MSANSRLTAAVHALAWLELAARRGHASLTSAEVASSLANNPVQVRQSLGQLREAALVRVTGRGPGAGWQLARPADEITLFEVYDALGDPGPFALHAHDPNPECTVGSGIRPVLENIYDDVRAAMSQQLRATTIADVLEEILAHDTTGWPEPDSGRRSPVEK